MTVLSRSLLAPSLPSPALVGIVQRNRGELRRRWCCLWPDSALGPWRICRREEAQVQEALLSRVLMHSTAPPPPDTGSRLPSRSTGCSQDLTERVSGPSIHCPELHGGCWVVIRANSLLARAGGHKC